MGIFWIATGILVTLIIMGIPIAFAIGIASIAFVLMASPPDLIMAPLRMYAGVNSFTLLALPFFILAAEIMIRAGVSTRLFAWVNMLVGRVRGGLAYVNIVESTIFGSISGAALSDIAALGKIEITSMVENGYEKDFSCALTAASSLQSPLIPPSSIAILYSGVMSLSVGSVLLGGAEALLPVFADQILHVGPQGLGILRAAPAAAERSGVPYKIGAAGIGAGGDSVPFSRVGLKALTLLSFKVPEQQFAFYHQDRDTPEVLTLPPFLNVLKLTLEWIRAGGE